MSYSNEIERNVRATADTMADKAADLAGKAGKQVDRAMNTAESAVRSLAEHGRDASERAQEVAGNFRSAIDRSVNDQPLMTLALAGVVGFVLGALWKS